MTNSPQMPARASRPPAPALQSEAPPGYDGSDWPHHDGLIWPHLAAAAAAGMVVSA